MRHTFVTEELFSGSLRSNPAGAEI